MEAQTGIIGNVIRRAVRDSRGRFTSSPVFTSSDITIRRSEPPRPSAPNVKLESGISGNENWKDFEINIKYLASSIKAFQEVDCDRWLNNIKSFKTDADKLLKELSKGDINRLEDQASNIILDALKLKDMEINNLKSQMNNVITMPPVGQEFPMNNLFIYQTPGDNRIVVAMPTTLLIDKVFLGQYGKRIGKKYTEDGFVMAEFRKMDGEYKAYSYRLRNKDFDDLDSFHTEASICLGDISDEVLKIRLRADEILLAFEKVMNMLRYINIESMHGDWKDRPELNEIWDAAKECLIKYYTEHDPKRVCTDCGSVNSEDDLTCLDCGHMNNSDDDVDDDDVDD